MSFLKRVYQKKSKKQRHKLAEMPIFKGIEGYVNNVNNDDNKIK